MKSYQERKRLTFIFCHSLSAFLVIVDLWRWVSPRRRSHIKVVIRRSIPLGLIGEAWRRVERISINRGTKNYQNDRLEGFVKFCMSCDRNGSVHS